MLIIGEVYLGALLAMATVEGIKSVYRRRFRVTRPLPHPPPACSAEDYADL